MKRYLLGAFLLSFTLVIYAKQEHQSTTQDTQEKKEEFPVEKSQFLFYTKPSPTINHLPLLREKWGIGKEYFPNPIGLSVVYSFTNEKYKIKSFQGEAGDRLTSLLGEGLQPWEISEGLIKTRTHAVGIKGDVFLFPFLQLFVLGAYLNVEQSTNVGIVTPSYLSWVPNTLQIPFPIGTIQNTLEGFVAMSGLNFVFGYKGLFASLMVSGGYAQLNDTKNNINGFAQKPVMYIAPRIGYQYRGILNIHAGVQRVELFGATKGKDLSALSGGLVKSYSVDLSKFPVNFLAGAQFLVSREFNISVEYVGSPDTQGLNIELVSRF